MIEEWLLSTSKNRFYLSVEFETKDEPNGIISFYRDRNVLVRWGGCYSDEMKTTYDGCPVVRRIRCL